MNIFLALDPDSTVPLDELTSFNRHHPPVPEPSTYGIIFVALCISIFYLRKYLIHRKKINSMWRH